MTDLDVFTACLDIAGVEYTAHTNRWGCPSVKGNDGLWITFTAIFNLTGDAMSVCAVFDEDEPIATVTCADQP
jgi:hypothetical protein